MSAVYFEMCQNLTWIKGKEQITKQIYVKINQVKY